MNDFLHRLKDFVFYLLFFSFFYIGPSAYAMQGCDVINDNQSVVPEVVKEQTPFIRKFKTESLELRDIFHITKLKRNGLESKKSLPTKTLEMEDILDIRKRIKNPLYYKTQEPFKISPEKPAYSVGDKYLVIVAIKKAYSRKAKSAGSTIGNLKAVLLSDHEPKENDLRIVFETVEKNITALISILRGKTEEPDKMSDYTHFATVLNQPYMLDIFEKKVSFNKYAHPYISAYLNLCAVVHRAKDSPEFISYVTEIINSFSELINSKVLVKENRELVVQNICSLYEMLAGNTQEIQKKKEYFSQISLYDLERGLRQKSFLILTESPKQSTLEEIKNAHEFFLIKKNDKEFISRYLNNYLQLGTLYAKGSPTTGIKPDFIYAEEYLNVVLSVPLIRSDKSIRIEACYTLASLYLGQLITLINKDGILNHQFAEQAEKYFVTVAGLGDIRGMFGLGLVSYWKKDYKKSLELLQFFWLHPKSNLYTEEFLISAWHLGTLLLIDDSSSLSSACNFFAEAKLFLPDNCATYFAAALNATSPDIKKQLISYADTFCKKIESNPEWYKKEEREHADGVSVLYIIGRLLLNDQANNIKKNGLWYLTTSAHDGSQYALLCLGCLPESSGLLANTRVAYLNALNKSTQDNFLWPVAQEKLAFLAKSNCLDAQVATALTFSDQEKLETWLNDLFKNPINAATLFETTIVQKSFAFKMVKSTQSLSWLEDLCKKDHWGAQFLLGNIFISCGDYEKGFPLLEQVQKKLEEAKDSVIKDEFKHYIRLVRYKYATFLIQSGLLKKDMAIKEKNFYNSVTYLQKNAEIDNNLAQLCLGLCMAANFVKEAQLSKLLQYKGKLSPKEKASRIENFFKNKMAFWSTLTFVEKKILEELFDLLPAQLEQNKNQNIINIFLDVVSPESSSKRKTPFKKTIASLKKEKEMALNYVSDFDDKNKQAQALIKSKKYKEAFTILEDLASKNVLSASLQIIMGFLDGVHPITAQQAASYYLNVDGLMSLGMVHPASVKILNTQKEKLDQYIADAFNGKEREKKQRATELKKNIENPLAI